MNNLKMTVLRYNYMFIFNMSDVLWYQRGELWAELEVESNDTDLFESEKQCAISPYPEPTEPRTMARLNGWNKYEFMRSANYYLVKDNDLPLSVFPYLLEKKNKSKFITFVRDRMMRPTLADFITEASWPITESNLEVYYKFGYVALVDHAHQVLNLPYFKSEINLIVQFGGQLSRLVDFHNNQKEVRNSSTQHNIEYRTFKFSECYPAWGEETEYQGAECTFFSILHPVYPWDETTFSIAAKYGRLDCLQYMHKQMVENGVKCNWDFSTFHAAAIHGHVDCLRYAYENKCPSDTNYGYQCYICEITAGNGHFECLKFLHEHGYLWLASVGLAACEHGHLDCLTYVVENGMHLGSLTDECIQVATKNGHLDCVRYLHSLQ